MAFPYFKETTEHYNMKPHHTNDKGNIKIQQWRGWQESPKTTSKQQKKIRAPLGVLGALIHDQVIGAKNGANLRGRLAVGGGYAIGIANTRKSNSTTPTSSTAKGSPCPLAQDWRVPHRWRMKTLTPELTGNRWWDPELRPLNVTPRRTSSPWEHRQARTRNSQHEEKMI
jgi:hypothetical protein